MRLVNRLQEQELQCLTYLPHSYSGQGPAESCAQVLSRFSENGIATDLYVPRCRASFPAGVRVHEALGHPVRALPFRMTRAHALQKLEMMFCDALAQTKPGSFAYFWPDTPNRIVHAAREAGLICVREMINSPLAFAKPLLESAYRSHGLRPAHGITQVRIDEELAQLALCDFIFASNPEVERALLDLGIEQERILSTTFGYSASKLGVGKSPKRKRGAAFRACFVGSLSPRKGILEALAAWEKANVDGEFWVAGAPDPIIKSALAKFTANPSLRMLGQVSNVAEIYRKSDVFIFPTIEEGGPQVTYEAAAFGLPAITTPMGAARLVEDGETGRIVPAGEIGPLAITIEELASKREQVRRLGDAAYNAVQQFEYAKVSQQRANLLHQIFMSRKSK